MKKSYSFVIVFGIFFLFFIQMAGTLVESIYILDLMNTALDEKALGLLFFFSPLPLLFLRFHKPDRWAWLAFGLLFLSRGLTPYLATSGRMLASGFATGAALILFPFLMTAKPKDASPARPGFWISAGFALGIVLSVFLRTVNYGLDFSLTPAGGWVGWVLGLFCGYSLAQFGWPVEPVTKKLKSGITLAVLGVFLLLTLVLFAFSAPAVIARWSEGNYSLIVIMISLLSSVWIVLVFIRPDIIDSLSNRRLQLWNLLFTLSLVGTLLAHRIQFPETPESPAVIVGSPTQVQQIPLMLLLFLFPVIFFNLRTFVQQIQIAGLTIRDLIPGMLLGSLALIILVFMHIFTNVWGYIEPVSPWFRNKFWLPYLLLSVAIMLLVARRGDDGVETDRIPVGSFHWPTAGLLAVLFLGTVVSVALTTRVQPYDMDKSALLVMTYNIQQANDDSGERSYDRQLALIRQISPDLLALQESDSTRVSLNNNDYVRYYAGKLGYYSYYGPKSVTGTYGTALLSRYPLQNTRTMFSYSDRDEIGTTVAEIEVNDLLFTIYNVHPAGSDTAMGVFAETLLADSQAHPNVIAMGDFNLRDYEQAYQLIDLAYTNAWTSVYPSEIGPDGVDMSGENRIDHIFFSPTLQVRNPVYILPPHSATDHPVHWAEIYWE